MPLIGSERLDTSSPVRHDRRRKGRMSLISMRGRLLDRGVAVVEIRDAVARLGFISRQVGSAPQVVWLVVLALTLGVVSPALAVQREVAFVVAPPGDESDPGAFEGVGQVGTVGSEAFGERDPRVEIGQSQVGGDEAGVEDSGTETLFDEYFFEVLDVWVYDEHRPSGSNPPHLEPPVLSQGSDVALASTIRLTYPTHNGVDRVDFHSTRVVEGPCGVIYGLTKFMWISGPGSASYWTNTQIPEDACPGEYTYTLRLHWGPGFDETTEMSMPLTITGFYTHDLENLFGRRVQAGYASDPVNTASGNFVHEEVDVEFADSMFGLDWGRWYNSADDLTGSLGRGWKTVHDVAVLGEDAEGEVKVRLADGRQLEFEPDGSGGYVRPDDFRGRLVAESDGSFRIDLFDGSSWDFDGSGRLVSMSNWDGQSVALTYAADGVSTVASSTGKSLTISYDGNGRISQVESNDGRSVAYAYDASGLLSIVTDSEGGETSYGYDGDGRLTEIIDPTETLVVGNTYDGLDRVTSQQTAGGATASFDYEFGPGETRVTSQPSGEVTIYRHDPEGRLLGVVDPFGNTVDLSRRTDGELTGATSRLGESLTQSFDDNANLLTSETETGGMSSYTYDSLDRVISATDPAGATTTYDYEGSERIPSTVTNHSGNVTSLTVTDGLMESVTDPDGVTTTYTYSPERLLVSQTDGAGQTTTFDHDAAGRVTSITTPEGGLTTYTYDAEGRLLTTTDPTGGVTSYTYDNAGRVLTVTDPGGGHTTSSYDAAGRLETTTDPRGAITNYEHDEFDHLISTSRPVGAETTRSYGNLGRLLSTTDPEGRTTSLGYDADGNQTTVTDPSGGLTGTERDTSGRVISTTDALGSTTTNSYDSSGRLETVTDPEGGITSYTYDVLGRVETVTDPTGGTTTTSYTAGGRVETVTDPEDLTTTYTYDDAGRVETITDPQGGVTTFGYDADGNQTSVTTPAGLTRTIAYDAAGRPLATTDPAGVSVTRTYDIRGNVEAVHRDGDGTALYNHDDRDLLDVTDPLGNTTTFSHDERGNRTSTTDALDRASTAAFNDADQVTSRTDALDRTTTTGYDSAGRVATVTDPTGRTVTNSYDAAGQLITQTFIDGTSIGFGYDEVGRRTSMTDGSGTTSYTYDPAGNLTSVTYPDASAISYAYDDAGRRSQVTYPDNSTVTYTYNDNGQVLTATHSTGGTATYTYDPDGRLTSENLPDGTTRSYTFTDGRLTAYTQNGTTTTLTYDTSGRLVGTSGGEEWSFDYDQAGQLISADRNNESYSYSYDEVGNLTSITNPSGTQTVTVDDANQLTASSDGNTYLYDQAGRLTEVTEADGTVRTYTYDARGLLTSESVVDICATLTPTIQGTSGDDTINGTNGNDIIFGLEGNDTINGANGNDIICGGPGNDTINGGGGGQSGNDILLGNAGNDTLRGGAGVDQLYGGADADDLQGEQGNDILDGGPGVDIINGGQHTDACEPEPTSTGCENALPTPLPIPGAKTISRDYNGDGLLIGVTINHPDDTTDIYTLLWDTNQPIPQVVTMTHNGATSQLVYGPNRAFAVGGGTATSFDYSVLGDATSGPHTAASSYDPYGNPDTTNVTVGFGYRSELHVGDLIHLRNRDLNPSLGRFTTTDPLSGVPGTTTVANQYHYANNNPVEHRDPTGLRATDQDIKQSPNAPDPFEWFVRPRDKYDDFLDLALVSSISGGSVPGGAEAVTSQLSDDLRGRIRISIFIAAPTSFGLGRGDDRPFDQLFDPYKARASIIIDYDRDAAAVVAQPSCALLVLGCGPALPFGAVESNNQAWIDDSGTTVVGSLKNAITSSPAIDFRIGLTSGLQGITSGWIVSDPYPSYEVYYDTPDGRIQTLFHHEEKDGAPWGLVGNPVNWPGPWLVP